MLVTVSWGLHEFLLETEKLLETKPEKLHLTIRCRNLVADIEGGKEAEGV
jgi:hypothetical protein